MPNNLPALLPSIFLVMALGLLPFLVAMGTAFTKISIVLSLLRNALGLQQAPSTLVINSIALTLTIFIMAPLGQSIAQQIAQADITSYDWDNLSKIFHIVNNTYKEYLNRYVSERELAFFMDAARKLWPPSLQDQITRTNMLILLPAHVTSEITRAFEIAFLLFLPFLVIDMVVSNILLAMGAMMVSPMIVSLPIKILLFVASDGWGRLIHNLVLSYI
ncbi:EscR/YscR/HrcR family type III secretion system export apparatus protein [Phyllobacterium salinisoli]|uniref:EscR/YscR/HrcR family type III secretion system export apparatus protein n=1 Tax=Phyllobacterium salinisoli TaxID=1899321 RepID=A0A368JXE5_9HYPH|nr:type III secretion system export apparatus subunit SctR [Phyllobacterium salinisoli]RCS21564.1 EscR/YscR/HrcR family type III secretion system export apparatus protein [Phyllobacterium salinisoli]